MVESILFDLDNTLVRCMIYFEFTRKNMYKVFSKHSGLSVARVHEIFDAYESERVTRKDGFSKAAFLDSVNQARVSIYNEIADREVAAKFMESDEPLNLINFAANVYEAPYTMYEDVPAVLRYLKAKGYALFCVTKGDFYGQSKKAAKLPELFDGLFVLPHKSKHTWNGVIETAQLNRETTLVVGDSVKDDINPALEVGLQAIRIDRLNTEWVGDPRMPTIKDVQTIRSLDELLKIL